MALAGERLEMPVDDVLRIERRPLGGGEDEPESS